MQQSRVLVQLLKEVAQEQNLQYTDFSSSWIIQLQKEEHRMFIYGYRFPFNSASIQDILQDKSATSAVLADAEVSVVEHKYFPHPKLFPFVDTPQNWYHMIQFAETHQYCMVCKDNQGRSGNGVYRIRNQTDLEIAMQELFSVTNGIALSPFYDIHSEYRVVVLCDTVELIYRKQRRSVIGDGESRLETLLLNHNHLNSDSIQNSTYDAEYIPKKGEEVILDWQHNLSRGAEPHDVKDDALRQKLEEIALKASAVLNMKFGAVDIIETQDQNFKVLEVNGGVSFEKYARYSKQHYQRVKQILSKAVKRYFEMV